MLPVLALSVPILDTLLTLIRRGVIHRGSMFSAERGHIHHRLLDLGLCQRHAVLILYAASFSNLYLAMLLVIGNVVSIAPMPKPAITTPIAKPRRSGNQRAIRPIVPTTTMPTPIPPRTP